MGSGVPFVEACHTSTDALATGFPVLEHVTWPYMKATSPSSGHLRTVVSPLGRTGVSARQKGPRIAVAVPGAPFSVVARFVMSSTSLPRDMFIK